MEQEEVQGAAVNLAKALAAMITAIREAVQASYASRIDDTQSSARRWEAVALPNLSTDLQKLQPCLTNPLTPATAETMLQVASNKLGLAKHLDAFRWDFAGLDHEQQYIESNVRRTVIAASALIKALRKPF